MGDLTKDQCIEPHRTRRRIPRLDRRVVHILSGNEIPGVTGARVDDEIVPTSASRGRCVNVVIEAETGGAMREIHAQGDERTPVEAAVGQIGA